MKIMKLGFICGVALALLVGCANRKPFERTEFITLEATGYCKCQECCGWKRNLLMQPVYAYGPQKGERKKLGVTASGTKAKPGTIAADTSVFPFGTRMKIPGYGWGTVEDRGGAIKGGKIDLFFKTHKQALEWGRQTIVVEVVMP
ncbi:MAG: 3D domain-containing protein [Verrucomicrobiota bacterium]